jgi:hypothetical protein
VLIKIGADGLELELGFWITDPENGRLNVLPTSIAPSGQPSSSTASRWPIPSDIRIMDERSFRQSTRTGKS